MFAVQYFVLWAFLDYVYTLCVLEVPFLKNIVGMQYLKFSQR
jgi:hypothetical protein